MQNGEFVTAEPRDDIAVAQAAAQPLAHLAQKLVAERMTQRVVDGLELIEVETKNRELLVPAQMRETIFHFLVEEQPVRQRGQPVMQRHVGDFSLCLPSLGDVFKRDNPAARIHRHLGQQDLPPIRERVDMARRSPRRNFSQDS